MVRYPNHTDSEQASQRQFTSTYCTFFHYQLTTALLTSAEDEDDGRRNIFMTK